MTYYLDPSQLYRYQLPWGNAPCTVTINSWAGWGGGGGGRGIGGTAGGDLLRLPQEAWAPYWAGVINSC